MIQNISSLYVSESFQDLVLVESSSNGNQLYSALGVEFNVTSASYAITSSWADNYDSSSLLKSSSINGYDITFVKGDGSEYILTVPTPESNGSVFHFLTASTEWTVVHNLDELYPLVEIYNLEDDVIGANSIESIDTNTTKITFTFPVAGHVNVSKAGNLSINAGSGSGTSGVSKIIAGTNVTISPSNGLGDVTINATGGGSGSVDTGSLLTTASISDNIITFEKGDGSTFDIPVAITGTGDVFHFPVANTVWLINHNLNQQYPVVQIYEEVTGDQVLPSSVNPIDPNNLEVTFVYPIAGYASVVKAGGNTSTVSSSFAVTASFLLGNVETALFASNSLSASYALNSTSASYALNSTSASFASASDSASYALNATTSSFAISSYSSSYSSVALIASNSLFSTSASYVEEANTALTASIATSASYALSASWAPQPIVTPTFPYTGSAIITGSLELTGSLKVTGSINGLSIGTGVSNISSNIAIGNQTLASNTTGEHNIAQGENALASNTQGLWNIAQGYDALQSNTIGNGNIAQGTNTLKSNIAGTYNIAQGYDALTSNTEGSNNIAQGPGTLASNTTGKDNIALGDVALFNNTVGESNIAIGSNVLYDNTEGENNIALGRSALYSNTEGDHNIALGVDALSFNTTGNYNIALGSNAGRRDVNDDPNTEGINSIFIGQNTKPLTSNDENQIVIGNGAIGLGSNSTVIGNSDITKTKIFGNTTIIGSLQISGSISGSNTITNETDTFSSTSPITKIVSLTAAEYSAIVTKDPNTLYITI
jgi:hypothetical protein